MFKVVVTWLKVKIKEERGDFTQTAMIIGIMLVIAVGVFWPQIKGFLETMLTAMTTWWTNTGSGVFK